MMTGYDPDTTQGLVELLQSIGRELEERRACLQRLHARLAELVGGAPGRDAEQLVAEIATHRRELRLSLAEVTRLGCTVVRTDPPTFRIPLRGESRNSSLVYRACAASPDC